MATENDEQNEDYGQEPWGADFNAQTAWNEIKSLRKENAKARTENQALKANALTEDQQQMLQEYALLQDASQTDIERMQAQLEAAQQAAGQVPTLSSENLRLRVALDKGLSPELINRLQGSTREELEADADTLLGMLAPKTAQEGLRPNPAQGTSGGGAPSIQDQIAEATKAGNVKLALQLKSQQLASLPHD